MDKRQIIAAVLTVADTCDSMDMHVEADKLTKIAQEISDDKFNSDIGGLTSDMSKMFNLDGQQPQAPHVDEFTALASAKDVIGAAMQMITRDNTMWHQDAQSAMSQIEQVLADTQ